MKTDIIELKLNTMQAISREVGQSLDLGGTLMAILEILSETLSMKRGTITLKDKSTGLLRGAAFYGVNPDEKKRGNYQPEEGITDLIFKTARPFAVPIVEREPLLLNRTRARHLTKENLALIGVPILLGRHPIGALLVDRLFDPKIAIQEDIRFLCTVATFIAQFVQLGSQVQQREAKLFTENRSLRAEVSAMYNHFFAVGISPPMQVMNKALQKAAPSPTSVLLIGEPGTGKTLAARIIHELSERRRNPFIKVNCAALTENLAESELFGHEKGAFTGATQIKKSLFEKAHHGTALIGGVGELSLPVQTKLLRFLQKQEFQRLGSTQTRKSDARIIATTHIDLSQAVEEGKFRSDLFYRLNVFPICIPPLRKRKSDIPILVDYFVKKISRDYGRLFQFSQECKKVLSDYPWPGNVRELGNLIERVAILTETDRIEPEMLPEYLFDRSNMRDKTLVMGDSESPLETMEKKMLIEALARNNWVQQKAAREIGLSLRQMGYRIKKFNLKQIIQENKKSNTLQQNQRPVSSRGKALHHR